MADVDHERSVQVVYQQAQGLFQLDESALASVLLSEEVADCRVALVSVVGAFRGGKSFLLDFMLRYVRAGDAAREDGSWLGAEREELGGFGWRGGSERDTTGLLLWSRPARVQLPSGESVAVLLMDTQGTFDSCSTMRDCSTIFALSTLLSSTQIYNLKDNIREDDLQHLQLFTEYGRMALASNQSGTTPFQSLYFLIRDWSWSDDQPHGAEGGRRFLESKIDSEDVAELQELRQHIKTCYESLDCFLMPHPGLDVCRSNFKGHLADIRDEFKQSLKEFVPLILEPKNLKLKKTNGQPMTGRDLFIHFKEYMKIFNSNDLPEPVSIMKATAEACLLSGVAAAREQYKREMGHARTPAVAPNTLRERHARARDEAVQTFLARKAMVDQQKMDSYALQLTQEFDASLPTYELLNEAKIKMAVADAKKKYNKVVLGDCSVEHLCLHPRDLTEAHRKGLDTAISELSLYTAGDKFAEDEQAALIMDLHDRYKTLQGHNNGNNRAAVDAALEEYCLFMESTSGNPPCVTSQELSRCHQKARLEALDSFKSRRNRFIAYYDDIFITKLEEAIEEKKLTLQTKNEENNDNAIQEAINAYKEYMETEVVDDQCLHPEDLKQASDNGKTRAFLVFAGRSTAPRSHAEDEYKEKLRQELNCIYEGFEATNKSANINAVKESFSVYCQCAGEVNFIVDWFFILKGIRLINIRHDKGYAAAMEMFERKRRRGPFYVCDQYRQFLEKVITDQYRHNNYTLAYRIFGPYRPPWHKSEDCWSTFP